MGRKPKSLEQYRQGAAAGDDDAPPRTNGRSRKPRAQAALFDRTVEDPALEELLEMQLSLEPEAKAYRAKKKEVRKLVEDAHPELVAGENGDLSGGWIRCGRFRFKPRKVERAAGEVQIGAGQNWSCPVEALD